MTTDAEYKSRCGKEGHPHYFIKGDPMCLCGTTVTKEPQCGDRGPDDHVFSLTHFEGGERTCLCGKKLWEGENPFRFKVGESVEFKDEQWFIRKRKETP
jgi:hypothetical protein